MKVKKYIFTGLFMLCAAVLSLLPFSLQTKTVSAATKIEYIVALSEYTVEDYDESVTIYAPDGSVLETEGGKFLCKDLGVYTIVRNGKTEKEVHVIYKPFDTTFVYEKEIAQEVKANEMFVLPKADVSTQQQTFQTYSICIAKEGIEIESFELVDAEIEYTLTVSGEYTITYSVVDMYGLTEKDVHTLNVLKSKDIVGVNVAETVCVLNEIDFSAVEGLYEGKSYPVNIQILNAENQEQALTNGKFLPIKTGSYKAVFSCDFPDESLVKEVPFEVVLAEGSLFSQGTNITSITLNEDTAKKKGLEIAASGAGASIYYNKMIDLSKFTGDDKLISFFVPYNEYSDVQDIRVTLIDAKDENNQISVYWKRSKSVGWEHLTYCLVEFNGYAIALNNESADPAPREVYGAVLTCSFINQSIPFNITYDREENALYTWRSASLKIKLLDLDDVDVLKNYRPWEGFSSEYVYMKVDFIANVKSAIQIESIDGIDLKKSNNEIADENYLQFTYRGENIVSQEEAMLNGYVGENYPLPIPQTNNLFGDIKVDFNLLVNKGEGLVKSDDIVEDYQFKPTIAGDYQAAYGYYDLYGNYQVKTFAFTVSSNQAPQINIYGENVSADIMSYCIPPEFTVKGGTGTVNKTVVYKYNGKEVELDKNGALFLNEKGYVEVLISAEDELSVKAEISFYIIVNHNVQLIDIEEIPLSYISGREHVLPDFTAIDYSLDENADGYHMAKAIYVDGELLEENRAFTCPTGVTSITVQYYGGKGTAKEVCKEIEIPVVDCGADNVVSLDKLFQTSQEVEGELFEFGYALKFDSDISLQYANLLTARELNLSVAILPNTTFYTGISFTLVDFKDAEKSLIVELVNISEKTADVLVNGKLVHTLKGTEGVYTAGTYQGVKYTIYSFNLIDYKGMLIDDARGRICNIETYASGEVYEGFTSGLVKLNISVSGCTEESELVINGLSNQNFTTYAIRNQMDKTGPSIAIKQEFERTYSFGDKLSIPAALSYDVLQGKGYGVELTVTTPGGTKSMLNGEVGNEWALNEYGTYKFEYASYDYFGNASKVEYFVVIKDMQKPEIIVQDEIPSVIEAGTTMTFGNYTATDNIGVVAQYVYVKTPQTLLLRVDGTYTFKETGVYSIIYYAKDAAGNDCTIVYELTVK